MNAFSLLLISNLPMVFPLCTFHLLCLFLHHALLTNSQQQSLDFDLQCCNKLVIVIRDQQPLLDLHTISSPCWCNLGYMQYIKPGAFIPHMTQHYHSRSVGQIRSRKCCAWEPASSVTLACCVSHHCWIHIITSTGVSSSSLRADAV